MFLPFAGALGALNPGSIDFDTAQSDSIETTANVASIGSGDFTVEARFKLNGTAAKQGIGGVLGEAGGGLYVYVQSNAAFLKLNNSLTLPGVNISTGVVYDLAFTRSGTTIRLFLDGVLRNVSSSGLSILPAKVLVGQATETGGQEVDGLIGFFHVTRRAKYTAAYTPAAVIEPDDDTLALIHNPTGIAIEEANGLALTLNNSPTADPTFLI